jgi:hypothetical protein
MRKLVVSLIILAFVSWHLTSILFVSAQDQITVTPTVNLNVRDNPSINGSILGQAPFHQPLPALSKSISGKWVQVTYNNQPGWVCADFLSYDAQMFSLLPVNNNVVDENCGGRTFTTNPNPPVPAALAPSIEITYLPPYGTYHNLQGVVHNPPPGSYIAVYIRVGGFWVKPYAAWPRTRISGSGYWACDVTTGGTDQNATAYEIFLLPGDYSTPIVLGNALPSELYSRAIVHIAVPRPPA